MARLNPKRRKARANRSALIAATVAANLASHKPGISHGQPVRLEIGPDRVISRKLTGFHTASGGAVGRFNDPIGGVFKARTVNRPHLGCRGYVLKFLPTEVRKVACECVECRAKRGE